MSQTVSLELSRKFTKNNEKAYDLLEWAKTDSVLKNPMTGEKVYEQLGVEFPVGWSLNAINIVSQKYFTGDRKSVV